MGIASSLSRRVSQELSGYWLFDLISAFADNPYWTVTGVAERMNVAFTTAQRVVERLESSGILACTGDSRRNRVYCAKAIVDILEEPARLAG